MLACTTSYDGSGARCPADLNRRPARTSTLKSVKTKRRAISSRRSRRPWSTSTSHQRQSEGYARGLREERRQEAVTVTAAAFSPCGEYLICASDSGRLAIWELAPYMNKGAWVEGRRSDTIPDLSFQADKSCINCLCFAGNMLLCGGDESVLGWPLSHLVSALETGDQFYREPTLCIRCPRGTARRGGVLPHPEVNGIRYDQTSGRVLCAAGDGKAYEWELSAWESGDQEPVRTYDGHRNYLHAVAMTPGSAVVATGSEDGFVGLWDSRMGSTSSPKGATLGYLTPARAKAGDGSKGSPLEGRTGAAGGLAAWVSCLEMDDGGHTLACGGGGGAMGEGGRGWVSQWNLATRTAIGGTLLPAEVQCMTTTDGGHTLLVAGAEPFVTYHTRSRLETKSRTPATPPSVYTLAVNASTRHEGITCVAGTGPTVDIYTLPGIVSFSLSFV